MNIKTIHNEDDYRAALRQIETLMNAQENTPEGDLLDILVTLVEAYERKAYPMNFPDPVEAIKFHMEQNEMTPKDLEPVIGRMNRVYEVLNHKRPLTLKMIRNLHGQFGIPAESLIKEPTRHRNTSA
ncbi:HTH-type transcriptional regulator / antitoxin HigA [Desulfomicrobium norvegicum]|uniref:HTH-type transcriptional regulator / antitoxin HigA n=1 Tax=Desulfomicrobium norvegicum (strain DSM 1741 / NCIMB 8310) TaxID=52561 RepID=A0A8G2FG12_DESNO|nr:transcriptional regulator [Desulfomicrobium norvegicum]SFM19675.1 HTH-type transcriptional regulator / antitoxin HigA [Desulfomicrobium norvegicum]